MALKAVLTKDEYDGLDAGLQEHYAQNGDSDHFALAVEKVGTVELLDVGNLRRSLSDERRRAKEAEKALTSFKDLDPEKAREAMTKLEELDGMDIDAKNAEWKSRIEKQLKDTWSSKEKQLSASHKEEVANLNGQLSGVTTELQAKILDSEAMSAVVEAGGNPKLLMPHIRQAVRFEKDDGGKLQPRIVGNDGEVRVSPNPINSSNMTISELVSELRNDKDYSQAFSAGSASGSGATGGDGTPRSTGSSFLISPEDAADFDKFSRAAQLAEKQGKTLEIG